MEKKTFYITTPIYYASAKVHIGHAYCTVMTDILARYKRERGYKVHFLTGADEHGEKIAKNAEKAGLDPQSFVDEIAHNFKENWGRLQISNDDFIRTTDQRHVETVQKVFSRLLSQGDIYLGQYKGWYCTPCEAFWTEMQVGAEHVCPDCGRPVHEESEEAYFLNVKKYVPQLLEFYRTHPQFVPGGKLNEMINTFIKPGLDDLCITRNGLSWGIPVQENPKHVIYVWIDALLNYISALGYLSSDEGLFREYWSDRTEIVQFAGREINRFHSIYWPILLFALGLRCPDTVFIHGLLLTRGGVKLSKSLGNAPSPLPLIDRYGLDAIRYYMAREVKIGEDGTFTPNQFVERTNADLTNNYGNLVNRTVSMIAKYYEGKIPDYKSPTMATTQELYFEMEKTVAAYEAAFDSYDVTAAAKLTMEMLDKGNKYIEVQAPWTLSKNGSYAELAETMYVLAEIIRVGTIMLRPFLVEKAPIVLKMLGLPEQLTSYESLHTHDGLSGLKTAKGDLLYPRLDKALETEYLSQLIDGE